MPGPNRRNLKANNTTDDYEVAIISAQAFMLFFWTVFLVYKMNHGSYDGVLIYAWESIKWLLPASLAVLFIVAASRKLRIVVTILIAIWVFVKVSEMVLIFTSNKFWVISIALIAGLVQVGFNFILMWEPDI